MNLQEIQTILRQGMQVALIENGREVARGSITRLSPGELEFTDADPGSNGFKKEFAYKQEWGGWKGLHDDPFTLSRCVSEFGAIYLFKPLEESADHDNPIVA